ncbi:hypothetical protein [Nostoc sp.]
MALEVLPINQRSWGITSRNCPRSLHDPACTYLHLLYAPRC